MVALAHSLSLVADLVRWPFPLRPVAGDNPGEMGGRVVSPIFVGRVEELHVLEVALGRATNSEPAVVLVGGEAGVGKTRLLAELTARCATDGTRVLTGGCVPVGDGALPYAPIVEGLRALVGDLGASAVRGLVGPSWPVLARLLPALGEPQAGGGPPDQAAQARLFELLLGMLARLSQQMPVTLVVEDLHWADRSTRDLMTFLARNLRRERLLVVVSYRNDEPGTDWLGPYLAVLDRSGHAQRVELSRLDRAETLAQLVGIVEAAPPAELVDAVFGRSGATRISPRSCSGPSGPAPVSCHRHCGICSAAGSRRCPSWHGRCLGWWRWLAGGSPTGSWPRSPAWRTRPWCRRSARRSPISCW
jgi:AAA ATPase domain